jgi:membrane protein required for colicin V production
MGIDAIAVIILIIYTIKGYSKGLLLALFSVIAILVGTIGALKLSSSVALWLSTQFHVEGRWLPLLSYALVFVFVVFAVRQGARLLQRSMDVIALGWLNRIAGAALYIFVAALQISCVLWLLDKMGAVDSLKSNSILFDILAPIAPGTFAILGTLLPFIKNIFNDLNGYFEHINAVLPYVDPH